MCFAYGFGSVVCVMSCDTVGAGCLCVCRVTCGSVICVCVVCILLCVFCGLRVLLVG